VHVSTKDTNHEGNAHLLTSTVESDNEFPLCSEDAELKGEVLSVKRTISGGIEVQVMVSVSAPEQAQSA
jgi:hypothetical protein